MSRTLWGWFTCALLLLVAILSLSISTGQVAAQDPTLDAAIEIIQRATRHAQMTANAQAASLAATREAQAAKERALQVEVEATRNAVAIQQTQSAAEQIRAADATRQALDTQAREQEIALTGTARAHQESIDATGTAMAYAEQRQAANATADADALKARAIQQSLDEQAAANAGVTILTSAIAILLILVGLALFRFLRPRPAPVTVITGNTGGSQAQADAVNDDDDLPRTIVIDATQGPGLDYAQAIARTLGDELNG